MARITGPVCRLCRREGMKLFLKGQRCDSPKCAVERRPQPPGMQASGRRSKPTDYGLHLREKQKVKHYYGVLERQFRSYFDRANRGKTNTGDALMSLLERRLDNVIHRLGFGLSRAQSRQIVAHGHILINGRRTDIPSYLVKPGDEIVVKNRPKSVQMVQANLIEHHHDVPEFLNREEGTDIPSGRVARLPGPEDTSVPELQAQLIIELCSK